MDEVISRVNGALGWFIDLDSTNKLILIGGFLALMLLLNWQWKRGRREKVEDRPEPSRPYPLPSRPTYQPPPRSISREELSGFDDVVYRPLPLMSQAEVKFWSLLYEAAPGFHIFPRMALSALMDFDSPDPGHYRAVADTVNTAVVGFVVCDAQLAVVALVELKLGRVAGDKKTVREGRLDFFASQAGYRLVRFDSEPWPDVASIKKAIFAQP